MSTSLKFQYDIKIEDLGVTTIENSFISLYMPQMPGNYVKIYLFGLRACQYGQPEALNNAVIALPMRLMPQANLTRRKILTKSVSLTCIKKYRI